VSEVNAVYSTGICPDGTPAGNFFVPGANASNIYVEPGLVSAPINLATSTNGNPGENDLALAIAALASKKVISGQTISDAFVTLVARIGADSREAGSRADTHTLTMQQLQIQRESVSGVSLDEEMTNMVKFQQSYNAAARVFTAIDEMIETVISSMGAGGR
jgi:flagellar hook-associated protein 1 FlgK